MQLEYSEWALALYANCISISIYIMTGINLKTKTAEGLDQICSSRRRALFLPFGMGTSAQLVRWTCTNTFSEHQKLYTDAEIYDPDILDHLTGDLVILEDGIEALRPARFPSSGEIVVNVYREGDHLKSECYCVDHDKQLVFFVKNFQARDLRAWEEVPGTMSQNHLSEFCAIL